MKLCGFGRGVRHQGKKGSLPVGLAAVKDTDDAYCIARQILEQDSPIADSQTEDPAAALEITFPLSVSA